MPSSQPQPNVLAAAAVFEQVSAQPVEQKLEVVQEPEGVEVWILCGYIANKEEARIMGEAWCTSMSNEHV